MKVPDEVNDAVTSAYQWVKTKLVLIWRFLSSINFLISLITIPLLLTGLSLMIIGVLIIVMAAKYELFLGISFFVLPIFVVVTAAVVLCTTVLGWYAVKTDKYHCFSAYLAILVAILIFEIAIAVLGFQQELELYWDTTTNHKMYESRMNYVSGENDGVDWNVMQIELQCCGYNRVEDYGLEIPLSCCPMPWRGQSPFQCTSQNAYYYGCRTKLNWMLANYMFALGVTASTVTCVQGIIILLAIWIACKMKNKGETSYRHPSPDTDYSQYHPIPGETAQ